MPARRRSTRLLEEIEQAQDSAVEFIRSVDRAMIQLKAPLETRRDLLSQGMSLSGDLKATHTTASVVDGALQSIGAIAQAGTDSLKVHRVIRELARDQERLLTRAA